MESLRKAEVPEALEFFSTHPSDANRLKLLKRTMPLAEENGRRRGCKEGQFQKKLDEILKYAKEP